MNKKLMSLTMLGLLAVAARADNVLYTLDTAGELTNAFHTPYTGTAVSQQATGGLNNSGSLDFRSGSGNQAWFSRASYAPLAEGQSLNDSLYFQFSGINNTSIKLGFASDPNATVDGVAMPMSGSWAYFGAWVMGSSTNINSEVYGSDGYIDAPSTPSAGFVNGNWYQMQFDMKLVDSASSAFEFSWVLNNSDSAGVLGSTILAGTTTNAFAGLNTTLHSYIGMENPTSSGAYTAIDNISLTSTGVIAVPEPSSYALAATGALALLASRRFRRRA